MASILARHVGARTRHTDYNSYLSSGAFNTSGNYDSSGFLGGGQVGLNYMITTQVLIGVEADGDWGNINGKSSGCTATAYFVRT